MGHVACGGATVPSSGTSSPGDEADATTGDGGPNPSEGDAGASVGSNVDGGAPSDDASPPPVACSDGGGQIGSCDYPGHTGQPSPEVLPSQIEACGFTDCGAYCKATNPGLPGVSCRTEEGTAKMYCTCVNP